MLLIALVTISQRNPPDRVEILDELITDPFWPYRNNTGRGPDYSQSAREVLVVTIDADSLMRLGQWPWRRTMFAELARDTARAGVRVIAFDFPMLSPSENEAEDLAMAREFLSNPRVVLANAWLRDTSGNLELAWPFWWLEKEDGTNFVDYAAEAHRIGFTGSHVGAEGVVRSTYLIYPGTHQVLWSFDFAVACLARQEHEIDVGDLFDRNNYVDELEWGDRVIPLTDGGFTINYGMRTHVKELGTGTLLGQGTASYAPSISFADLRQIALGCREVDDYRALEEVVKDKILLVGITAVNLKDGRGIPLGVTVPPVYIHADILASLLEGKFVTKLVSEYGVLLAFLAGLAISTVMPRLDQARGLILVLTLSAAFYAFAAWSFIQQWVLVPVMPVLLALWLPYGFISWYINRTNEQDKALIRNLFGGYLSPKIVDNLIRLKDQGKLGLHGRKLKLTIFYSDIRGFTAMSETLDPYQVVSLLNEHFDRMTRIAYRHDAYVDKFIGDSLMAVFSAPLPRPDDALRAVRMANEMMQDMERLNEAREARGDPTYRVGMAIHTGPVVLGNIGSPVKMDYTVIGDAVNLTSRLCAAAGPGQILISEVTYDEVRDHVEVRELEALALRGKTQPVKVYEVIGLK